MKDLKSEMNRVSKLGITGYEVGIIFDDQEENK